MKWSEEFAATLEVIVRNLRDEDLSRDVGPPHEQPSEATAEVTLRLSGSRKLCSKYGTYQNEDLRELALPQGHP